MLCPRIVSNFPNACSRKFMLHKRTVANASRLGLHDDIHRYIYSYFKELDQTYRLIWPISNTFDVGHLVKIKGTSKDDERF